MNLGYTVHSVTTDPIEVNALVGGKEVKAMMMGLTVELLAVDSDQSITLRLTDDIEAATELFTVDRKITATFAAAQ